jgi:branched-chain amino acid aminotransferase
MGTGWEVLSIVEVDGMKIGEGTMGRHTRALDRAYHDLVRGRVSTHASWRQPVHGEGRSNDLPQVAAWKPGRA